MYRILGSDDPGMQAALEALKRGNPTARYAVVELSPDESGGFAWVDAFHHEVEGALRSCRYLAQKAAAAYDPADPRGKKVLESIEHHLQTIETLKTSLVDRIFP